MRRINGLVSGGLRFASTPGYFLRSFQDQNCVDRDLPGMPEEPPKTTLKQKTAKVAKEGREEEEEEEEEEH